MGSSSDKCILIVDDEAAVRGLLQDMLSEIGLKTLAAESGEAALEMLGAHRTEIGLVIMDISMPGMDGRQAFVQMISADPTVRVVLSSGYGAAEVGADLKARGLAGFIEKPYRFGQVKALVRQMLGVG